MLKFRERTNTWPGFVDLFSNLVIILIFLLIVFVFLWTTTSVFNAKTGVRRIAELNRQNASYAETIANMNADEQEAKRLLVLARAELDGAATVTNILENDRAELQNALDVMSAERDQLELAQLDMARQLQEREADLDQLTETYRQRMEEVNANREDMRTIIEALTAQLNATRHMGLSVEEAVQRQAELSSEIARLNAALDAAETRAHEQEIQYLEMSNRLNAAMADKIAEMSEYQSQFYRAVRTALAGVPGVEMNGDRFVIASDILFASGAYQLTPEGKNQLRIIARVVSDLENRIPSDVNWIIRVDGHTDKKRVIPGTQGFRNNTQLSLLRATAVVNELVAGGVSRRRLAPAGFGEFHPLELGTDASALQKNRRIELRLTNP